MKILLIAGHGAGDPGACGNGYKEADLARDLAKQLESILKDYADVTIFDTTKNMYKYLKAGGSYNFTPYDYILEIHFNAGGTSGNGTEVLVHANQNGTSVEETIVKNISALGFKNRGVKRRSDLRNMNVIFAKGKDYALLETCFISSALDMNIWKNKSYEIALAVANGIISGFGLKLKKVTVVTELTTVNDIVWELAHRGIISDKALWLKKLEEDPNAYWLARKAINYIRGSK